MKNQKGKPITNCPIIARIGKIFNDSHAILDLSQSFQNNGQIVFSDFIVFSLKITFDLTKF